MKNRLHKVHRIKNDSERPDGTVAVEMEYVPCGCSLGMIHLETYEEYQKRWKKAQKNGS